MVEDFASRPPDDPDPLRARCERAARNLIQLHDAVEAAWGMLDPREMGADAYHKLHDDAVGVLGFTAAAPAVLMALRRMARVLAPDVYREDGGARAATPRDDGPPVADVRLALLAVQHLLGCDVTEEDIAAWGPHMRAEALAWACDTQLPKPGFLP